MSKRLTFQDLMSYEITRLRAKYPDRRLASLHEAYGLMLEEFDEAWDEIKKKTSKRNLPNLLRELVQIASICERTADELGLLNIAHSAGRIDSSGKIDTSEMTL